MALQFEVDLKDGVSKPAKSASDAVKGMSSQFDNSAASSAGLQEELAAMTGGLSLVAEAAGAVVLGLGALVAAGAAFAIKASEAKQASLSLWDALGQGAVSGAEIDDMLDDMRTKFGVTKDSLAPFTTAIMKMGITSKDQIQNMTLAAASAEAIAKGSGDAYLKIAQLAESATSSGQKLVMPFKKLQSQLVAAGTNIDDVAAKLGMSSKDFVDGMAKGTIAADKFGEAVQDAVIEKGAGPMQRLANSSANLGKLLEEYLGDLFEDLGSSIEPFMAMVRDLFGIFDSKTKPSGQALKTGIGAFFKEVFTSATKVVPMVKHFLLDLIIYGLKAYIALKPIVKTVKEFLGSATGMFILNGLWKGFLALAITIGAVIGVVVGVFALLWAITTALVASFWALIGAIVSLTTDAQEALNKWVEGAVTAAEDFISGLVKGIGDGATKVVGAVKGVASDAVGAFKDALGIHSPSKVMMQLGAHTAAGAAEGIEGGTPDVQAASSGMAGAAVAGMSNGGGSPSSGGGVTVNVEPGAIVIQGAGKDAESLTEQMVSLIFERVALAQGV